MRTSESIVNLTKALLSFQKKVDKIKKSDNNPFFKSKYASLSTILDSIDDILNDCGIVVLQSPENGDSLTTTIIHAESGEFIESTYSMRPSKDDPQGRGSCITYMRRYALSSILKLNVDDDDDGNAASSVSKQYKNKEYTKPAPKPPMDLDDMINELYLCQSMFELEATFKRFYGIIKNNFDNPNDALGKIAVIKDEMKEKFGK